jgi:putative DNA primase/helicase
MESQEPENVSSTKADPDAPPEVATVNGNGKLYKKHLTDAGNAEVFVGMYGEFVRYDHARKRWLVWQGNRWQPDADATVYRCALQAARHRFRAGEDIELDEEKRKLIVRWAFDSESRTRLEAALAVARTMKPIADPGEGWDTTPGIVGAPNGVIDLGTGELRDGRPEDRITMSVACEYDPTATCPRWETFLLEIFDNDEELVAYVKRIAGATLSGEAILQLVMFCMGVPFTPETTKPHHLRGFP